MGHPKECPCVFRLLFISVIQNMLNKSVEVRRNWNTVVSASLNYHHSCLSGVEGGEQGGREAEIEMMCQYCELGLLFDRDI